MMDAGTLEVGQSCEANTTSRHASAVSSAFVDNDDADDDDEDDDDADRVRVSCPRAPHDCAYRSVSQAHEMISSVEPTCSANGERAGGVAAELEEGAAGAAAVVAAAWRELKKSAP